MLTGAKRVTGHRRSLSSSSRRLIAIGALALAALGVATVATRAVAIRSSDLPADDFTQDYISARAWSHNDDPYGFQRTQLPRLVDADIAADSLRPQHRNPHSPAQILLTAPLSALPYRDARTVWLLISAGSMMVAAFAIARSLRWSTAASFAASLGALAIPVVGRDLLYGQLGGPLLALLVLAWLDMRRGNEARAGLALGAAIALKLFPAFLLIPIIRKRRAEMFFATIATAGALSIIGMLVIGFDESWNWMTEVAPDNFRFWRASPVNIALPALPFRWLTDSPWRADGPDLVSFATMLAIGLVIVAEFMALKDRSALTGDPFISALPWMLLAGPLTGDLSLPIVLPFAVLAARSAWQRHGVGQIVLLSALAVLAIGTPPGLPGVQSNLPVVTLVLGYGLPTIALLALGLTDGLSSERRIVDRSALDASPSGNR